MSAPRTIRGRVAIAGIGETAYYKHGRAPESEFALALHAPSCAPARTPGSTRARWTASPPTSTTATIPSRLAAALGLPELRFSNMQWGGGGGGGSAAGGNAAAAVAAGYADCVVVSARSPRASSSASGPHPRAARCRARRRSPSPTA